MPRRTAHLALLALLLAGPARADYKDTYRKAVEAVDRKRWPEVVELMREAIRQNPQEGERVKLYGMRFEPYVPHFHLGIALQQTGDCGGALAELQLSESQGAIRSTPLYAELANARQACQAKVAQNPPPTTRPTPPPVTAAPPTPPPTSAATPAPATPVPTTLAPLPVGPRPSGPPPELVRAASLYFSGRYEEAASSLDRLSGLSGRAAAQARLFSAAARLALYRIGGEKDASLRQRVLDDLAACRRADPNLRPDPEAFPPSLSELYRTGR